MDKLLEALVDALVGKSWLLALLLVIGAALLNGGILFAFQISFQHLMDMRSKRAEKRENYIAETRLKFLDELQKLYELIVVFFSEKEPPSVYSTNDSASGELDLYPSLNSAFPLRFRTNDSASGELDLYRKIIEENRKSYANLFSDTDIYKKLERQTKTIQGFYELNKGALEEFSESYNLWVNQWMVAFASLNILFMEKANIHDDNSVLSSLDAYKELSNQYYALFMKYIDFSRALDEVRLLLIGLMNHVRNRIY